MTPRISRVNSPRKDTRPDENQENKEPNTYDIKLNEKNRSRSVIQIEDLSYPNQ